MKTKVLIGLIILISLLPADFIFAQNSSSNIAQTLQQQITELQKQIVNLQAQLEMAQKTEVPTASNIIFTKTLRHGMNDNEVGQLQKFLKQFPEIYPEGLITGYFGSLTEAAVKRFQMKYDIEMVGIVGPKTRQKLNELVFSKPEIKPEEKITGITTTLMPVKPQEEPTFASVIEVKSVKAEPWTALPGQQIKISAEITGIVKNAKVRITDFSRQTLQEMAFNNNQNGTYIAEFSAPSKEGVYLVDIVLPSNSKNSERIFEYTTSFLVATKTCVPIIENGSHEDKLDVVFLTDNVTQNELSVFAGEMLPYMIGTRGNKTLFKPEPLASNKNKFNFYLVNETKNYNCGTEDCSIKYRDSKLTTSCEGYDVLALMLKGQSKWRAYGTWYSQTMYPLLLHRGYLFQPISDPIHGINYEGAGSTFTHEFGHVLGLHDEYTLGKGAYITYALPVQCDLTGCPSWCSGVPSMPYSEYETICTKLPETECKNSSECFWLPSSSDWIKKPEDYFSTTPCIKIWSEKNNGISCQENSGCYQGCGGKVNLWRSSVKSIMDMGYDSFEFNFPSKKKLNEFLSKYQ